LPRASRPPPRSKRRPSSWQCGSLFSARGSHPLRGRVGLIQPGGKHAHEGAVGCQFAHVSVYEKISATMLHFGEAGNKFLATRQFPFLYTDASGAPSAISVNPCPKKVFLSNCQVSRQILHKPNHSIISMYGFGKQYFPAHLDITKAILLKDLKSQPPGYTR
jgi:hypothetical protein